MKHIIMISLLFSLILTGCGKESVVPTLPDPVPDQIIHASVEGISLSLVKDSFIGSPQTIETLVHNSTTDDYRLGEFYHIEFNKDGQWYIMTYSDTVFLTNPRFKDYGDILPAGTEVRQEFSVAALGVTLIPGEYRLVKTVSSRKEPYHEVSMAVPFLVK